LSQHPLWAILFPLDGVLQMIPLSLESMFSFWLWLAQPAICQKIVLSGGVGTGPAQVVHEWTGAFQSMHYEEVIVDGRLTGGSASLNALVGQVDCKKKFKHHHSLCSTPPVENSTLWGNAGLTFPDTWYSEHRGLGLQLLPSVVGAICIVYSKDITGNLGSTDDAQLNVTFEVVAAIFAGHIKHWDDPRLQRLNPNIVLPHERVTALVRSDKSSLNEHLTKAIGLRIPWWSQVPGFFEKAVGKKPHWPLQNYSDPHDPHYLIEAGQQAMLVRMLRTPFSFSFLDFEQVQRFREFVATAHILNNASHPVKATIGSIERALGSHAARLQHASSTLAVDLHIPSDPEAYPLARVMYWYIKKAASANSECYKAWLLKEMILFSYSDSGKVIAQDYGWIRPPSSVLVVVKARLSEMMCINVETGQEMRVMDYVPPRYRFCPQGQFLKSVANASGIGAFIGCQNCSAGFYQPIGASIIVKECLPSPRGTMTPGQGQAQFTACPSGTFQAELGMDRCEPCPAGKYNPSQSSGTCFPCPPGHSTGNLAGLETCTLCPRSTFAQNSGAAICESCPRGLETRGEGHRNASDCSCRAGFRLTANSLFCQRCPEELLCLGYGAEVQAAPGYMLFVPKTDAAAKHIPPQGVYRCRPAWKCPGGAPETCSGGAIGFACASCPEGEYLVQGACQQCEGTLGVSGLIVMLAFVVAAALGASMLVIRFSSPSNKMSPKFVILTCFCQSIIQSLQILGLFTVLVRDTPEGVSHLHGQLSILVLDLRIALGAECFAWSALAEFVALSSVVPLALAVLALVFFVDKLLYSQFSTNDAANLIGGIILAGVVPLFLVGLTPMMCYSHPAGVESLLLHPDVLCGSDDHRGMLVFGILILLGVLAFTSLVAYLCWIAPSKDSKQFVLTTNFLFLRVRPQRWYWSISYLVRSLLLSLLPVVFGENDKLQCMMCALVLLLFGHLHVFLEPLRIPLLNRLEVGTVMLFTLAMICAVAALSGSPGITDSLFWTLYVLMAVAGLVLVGASVTLCFVAVAFWRSYPMTSTCLILLQRMRIQTYHSMAQHLGVITGGLKSTAHDDLMARLGRLEVYDMEALSGGVAVMQSLLKRGDDFDAPKLWESEDSTRSRRRIPSITSLSRSDIFSSQQSTDVVTVVPVPQQQSPVNLLE